MKYKLFYLFLCVLLLTGCTLLDSESSEVNEVSVKDLISTDETRVWFSGENENQFTLDLDKQGIYPDFKIDQIFIEQNQEIISSYDCENLHISDLKTLDSDQIINFLKTGEINGVPVQYNSNWKYPATFEIHQGIVIRNSTIADSNLFYLSISSSGNQTANWDFFPKKIEVNTTDTNEIKNLQSFMINDNNNFTEFPLKGFLTNISIESQNGQNENYNLSQYLFYLE